MDSSSVIIPLVVLSNLEDRIALLERDLRCHMEMSATAMRQLNQCLVHVQSSNTVRSGGAPPDV
jgi:hypothetical protein